jgi:hypothetical protein
VSITKSTDWLCARAGDEVMMMSASQGTYIGLNAMGARIWDLLDTTADAETLCARLLGEFDVGEAQCRAEVEAFLAELEDHKAITRSSAVAAG